MTVKANTAPFPNPGKSAAPIEGKTTASERKGSATRPDCVSSEIKRFVVDHPGPLFNFGFERDDRWDKVGVYLEGSQ